MSLLWRVMRKTLLTGFVSGTLYFIIIGALTFFTSVFSTATVSLLWLILFVGTGAGLGLLLGALAGASMSVLLRLVPRDSPRAISTARVVGALAAGLPVLAVTVAEQLTGFIGAMSPEWTTVVVIPTAVAVIGGASSAPNLLRLPRPGDQAHGGSSST